MDEIAADMREGLLALAVGAGLQVMAQLMEADVTAACGPRGKHDPDRTATRHGTERGLGHPGRPAGAGHAGPGSAPSTAPGRCRCRPMSCSPAPSCSGGWRWSGCWPGCRPAATRSRLEPVGEQVEADATSTSKSAVSRRFVAMTETALADLLAADLSGLDLVALMIDGVHFADHLCVVALGIDIDGTKHPLGAGRGIDGEHHPGPGPAGRAARPRPGRHPADPGRPGRRQGPGRGGQGGVRPPGDRPLPAPQDPQRP